MTTREHEDRISRLMAASMRQEALREPQERWPAQAVLDLATAVELLYDDRERLRAENARLKFLLSPPVER